MLGYGMEQGVSSQEISFLAWAWGQLEILFMSEPEPSLAQKFNLLPSPSRAELRYPIYIQAQAEPS